MASNITYTTDTIGTRSELQLVLNIDTDSYLGALAEGLLKAIIKEALSRAQAWACVWCYTIHALCRYPMTTVSMPLSAN